MDDDDDETLEERSSAPENNSKSSDTVSERMCVWDLSKYSIGKRNPSYNFSDNGGCGIGLKPNMLLNASIAPEGFFIMHSS